MFSFTKVKNNIRIIAILCFSTFLNFYDLAKEGYANLYYSAGVKSMLTSFKNFFFVSLDSAGFVSIDKPPLGFWIQAISAKIFGFSGWSVLIPQALAGVISVYLIYYLVKKAFGGNAGLLAALLLSITPMFVATSRNNTIDNLLIVTLLLAAVFTFKAAEKGSLKYLLISAFIVGLGFNIKMLQAYMVLPAIYGLYFLSNKISLKKRILNLLLATLMLFSVSLSWATIVEFTDIAHRPYVGSSEDNSVYELIFGHNGISRFSKSGGPADGGDTKDGKVTKDRPQPGTSIDLPSDNNNMYTPPINDNNMRTPPTDANFNTPNNMSTNDPAGLVGPLDNKGNAPVGSSGGGGNNETGNSGIFRMFNSQLSGQISWTLPFAIIASIFLAIKLRFNFILDTLKKKHLFFWIVWAVPMIIYFSFTTGIFHRYYLSMIAPAIAALTAMGMVSMWNSYKNGEKISIILPISIAINGIMQSIFLYYYSYWDGWLIPIVLTCSIGTALVLMIFSFDKLNISANKELINIVISIGVIAQLIAPVLWSSTLINYPGNGALPYAGPELMDTNSNSNSNNTASINSLVSYLEENNSGEKFLVAAPSALSYGSDIILNTDYAVMVLGGFGGSDNILSIEDLMEYVENGDLRYLLIAGDIKMGMSSNNLNSWVMTNGKLVDSSEWQENTTNNYNGQNIQLYDLQK